MKKTKYEGLRAKAASKKISDVISDASGKKIELDCKEILIVDHDETLDIYVRGRVTLERIDFEEALKYVGM